MIGKAQDDVLQPETNRIRESDLPVHGWYRFVLSFPPHLVRDYVNDFGLGKRDLVLDPFCGTGTTLVESKKLGIKSVGLESNSLAHFVAATKVDWSPDPAALVDKAEGIAQAVARSLAAEGISDDPSPLFGRPVLGGGRGALLGLSEEAEQLLLKNSISPLPLHKSLRLVSMIDQKADLTVKPHLRLALAKALIEDIGNLHFGPEVGVGRIKEDAPVLGPWLANVRRMATDLRAISDGGASSKVVFHDSRDPHLVLPKARISAVITSPPYPNEKDYTRTTRLESVLLGFLACKSDLRSLKNGLLRSNTRNVFVKDDDDTLPLPPEVEEIASAVERRRIELGKTSGFERLYHRVVRLYFGGMAKHLAGLRTCLRPGALLAYVVGDQASFLQVMIPTGQVLARVAETLGYRLIRIDLFRTRAATATRQRLREEVVVLEWPGN